MSRRTRSEAAIQGIPDATIARLPLYLRALYALADRDIGSVSSEELAAAAGVNSAKLRKDLSHLGSYGTRGVGYDVDYLIYQVSRELGLTQDWPVVIVGAGNLGRALANYGGFASRGFHVAAMLDSDPLVVGTVIAGHKVRSADEIEPVVAQHGVMIGAITAPAPAAQAICDRLVAAGVTSILNFAPEVLNVPDGVDVRKVDLSIELQILAFHAQRRSVVRAPRPEGSSDDVDAVAAHGSSRDCHAMHDPEDNHSDDDVRYMSAINRRSGRAMSGGSRPVTAGRGLPVNGADPVAAEAVGT
jgi:redox-sensing transcriptional repressor